MGYFGLFIKDLINMSYFYAPSCFTSSRETVQLGVIVILAFNRGCSLLKI